MDVVVGGIPGDDQADRRDMQAGRVVGVGMPEVDDHEVVALEIDHLIREGVGDHEVMRDLAGKQMVPEGRDDLWRRLLAHVLDHGGSGEGSRVGKAVEDDAEAKEVVTVAVGDVDRCQVLPGCGDPCCESVGLVGGHEGVDQDGVPFARDQSRRYW